MLKRNHEIGATGEYVPANEEAHQTEETERGGLQKNKRMGAKNKAQGDRRA